MSETSIPFHEFSEGDEIKAVSFVNGVPFIVFKKNGCYAKMKAPKSYFESLGLVDNTDEYGKPIAPSEA